MRCTMVLLALFAAYVLAACSESAPATRSAPVGTTAVATLTPLRATQAVDGTAQWTVTTQGVDMMVRLAGCMTAREYPVAIYDNAVCAEVSAQGRIADGLRGADLPKVGCDGGSGGRSFYARAH